MPKKQLKPPEETEEQEMLKTTPFQRCIYILKQYGHTVKLSHEDIIKVMKCNSNYAYETNKALSKKDIFSNSMVLSARDKVVSMLNDDTTPAPTKLSTAKYVIDTATTIERKDSPTVTVNVSNFDVTKFANRQGQHPGATESQNKPPIIEEAGVTIDCDVKSSNTEDEGV
jgi:hypothetical protein